MGLFPSNFPQLIFFPRFLISLHYKIKAKLSSMESKQEPSADSLFVKLKDVDNLYFLKRRPRCADGSLNLSHKVNKGYPKHQSATDYYDPKDPSNNVA